MKVMESRILVAFLCLSFAFTMQVQAQIQVNMTTINSLKPAKADVDAIDAGIADIQKQLDAKNKADDIAYEIKNVEQRIENVRRDFKKFKRLEEWDASVTKFKADQTKLQADQAAEAKAKREKDDALYELRAVMSNTYLERDIANFRANPTLNNGDDVVKGFSLFAQRLEKFRKAYPNETEAKEIKAANEADAYVQGEFLVKYIDLVKTERSNSDKAIAAKRASRPDDVMDMLESRISHGVVKNAAFPNTTFFADNLASDRKVLAEVEAYKTDGGYDSYLADQVHISSSKGHDAAAEASIKKTMTNEGYTVSIVSLQDDIWVVVKNDFGIPKYVEKTAEVGVRKAGECFRVVGSYRREYAGAGTYLVDGYFRWNNPVKMNCNNLK